MTARNLDKMSREELLGELRKLEDAARRDVRGPDSRGPERVLHDLHVHQVELEMQNRELQDAQGRIEESRSRYADLYDFAPVGYCTLDPAGIIVEVNLTGAALLGAPREALTGKPFATAARLEDSRAFFAHMRRCTQEKARVTSELLLSSRNRGGRAVQILSDPVTDGHGAVIAYRTILIDISTLKDLEAKLRLLSRAGEVLGRSLDTRRTLELAATLAVPVLADLCMVDVSDETGTIARPVVLFADPGKQTALAETLRQFIPRAGWQTPQARVIESREPMLLSEVSDELRGQLAYNEWHADSLRAAGVRSIIVVPLLARGRSLGALTLFAAESERRYTPSDLRLAQDLADRIARALDNASLYTAVQDANRALHLAEAKSSGILSTSADAIISIDEAQRITLFNEGAEQIFRYSKTEAIGAPLEMLIPERLRAGHRRHVEGFSASEGTSRRMGERRTTIVGLRKNGEEFPVEAAISKLEIEGKAILTVALRDVTEQRRIEKEQIFLADVGLVLATTLDYDETLTKIVELAVRDLADLCVIDIIEADGRVQRWKGISLDPSKVEICAALLRVPLGGGHHLTSAALETKRPVLMDRATLKSTASFSQSEENAPVLRAVDPQSAIAVPLIAHGQLIGALALVSTTPSRLYAPVDISVVEELAHRAALSIENATLYRTAKRAVQARDDVLSFVAHDLRNPLGVILNIADLLQLRTPATDRRSRKPGEAIARAVHRMNHLIQDLLDVSKMEGGGLSVAPASTPAEQILSDTLAAEKELATAASLELRIESASGLPNVWADHDRILQAFENLVGNAIKFTERGGQISLGAERRDGEVVFRVKDTGHGIAPGDAPHVFDRFWQARKPGRSGAGMGLPIVKGIVEAHGGRVWFESRLGEGTTFFFTLPRNAPH